MIRTGSCRAGGRWSHRVLVGLATTLASACGDEASGPEFELPQIVPQSTVLCLSYEETRVGRSYPYTLQLANAGRDQLVIERATIEGAEERDRARGAFAGLTDEAPAPLAVRTEDGIDCANGSPCRIQTGGTALARFTYTPPSPGWDAGFIRVSSNAQNFPNLRVFVLALGLPADGPSDGYDPGMKPEIARGADGSESCPDDGAN